MIVTDYDMPRMTGFELVHALKRDPKLRDIPTLMLTARDTRRDQAQMRAVGLTSLPGQAVLRRQVRRHRRARAGRAPPHRLQGGLAPLHLRRRRARRRGGRALGPARPRRRARRGARDGRALLRHLRLHHHELRRCSRWRWSSCSTRFFDVMCPILKAEAADIDKFIGDAIMALFDELPDGDPAPLRAVRAALSMQAALRRVERQAQRPRRCRSASASTSGRVVRGDIGSRHVRRDYTVIGDVGQPRPALRGQRAQGRRPRR